MRAISRHPLPESDDFPADGTAVQRLLDKLTGLKKGWPVATSTGAAERSTIPRRTEDSSLRDFCREQSTQKSWNLVRAVLAKRTASAHGDSYRRAQGQANLVLARPMLSVRPEATVEPVALMILSVWSPF